MGWGRGGGGGEGWTYEAGKDPPHTARKISTSPTSLDTLIDDSDFTSLIERHRGNCLCFRAHLKLRTHR